MKTDAELAAFLRPIADFPKPGIVFQDLTPLLGNADAWGATVLRMSAVVESMGVDVVAGVEARGFLIGAAVARELNVGFVPIRKPGKLPADVERVTYDLEYGTDALEVHRDAPVSGRRVVILDDVLATGGTARAAGDLIRRVGGDVSGYAFIIELEALAGRAALEPSVVTSLILVP